MKKISILVCIILISGFVAGWAPKVAHATAENLKISGEIVNGYRVISIGENETNIRLNVYRGDYIKFEFDESFEAPVLSIPDLLIEKQLPPDIENAPYFKMKKAGKLF